MNYFPLPRKSYNHKVIIIWSEKKWNFSFCFSSQFEITCFHCSCNILGLKRFTEVQVSGIRFTILQLDLNSHKTGEQMSRFDFILNMTYYQSEICIFFFFVEMLIERGIGGKLQQKPKDEFQHGYTFHMTVSSYICYNKLCFILKQFIKHLFCSIKFPWSMTRVHNETNNGIKFVENFEFDSSFNKVTELRDGTMPLMRRTESLRFIFI